MNAAPLLRQALGLAATTHVPELAAGAGGLRLDGHRYFCKAFRHEGQAEAEADGLRALAAAGLFRVPEVIAVASGPGDGSVLVLEWLDLAPLAGPAAAKAGERLARLHGLPQDGWGWHRDNWLGAMPQQNAALADWPDFLGRRRLQPQLQRASEAGLGKEVVSGVERIIDRLPVLLADPGPASLVHGDLWHGNLATTAGEPTLFDPAVHCAPGETDLAMLELFGGPGQAFFDAYAAIRPIDPGYPLRRDIYQLYHLLNHFNLFGGGYGPAVKDRVARIRAEGQL